LVRIRHISLTKEIAQELSLPVEQGSYVYSDDPRIPAVYSGGPAEKAGFKVKDIIVELNGVKLSSDYTLVAALLPLRPGDKVKAKVLRENKEIELEATLGLAPNN